MEMEQPKDGASLPTPTPAKKAPNRRMFGAEGASAPPHAIRDIALLLCQPLKVKASSGATLRIVHPEGAKTPKEHKANRASQPAAQRGQEVPPVRPVAATPGAGSTRTTLPCFYGANCGRNGCGYSHPEGVTARQRHWNKRQYLKKKKTEQRGQEVAPVCPVVAPLCIYGAKCGEPTCPFPHPPGAATRKDRNRNRRKFRKGKKLAAKAPTGEP